MGLVTAREQVLHTHPSLAQTLCLASCSLSLRPSTILNMSLTGAMWMPKPCFMWSEREQGLYILRSPRSPLFPLDCQLHSVGALI